SGLARRLPRGDAASGGGDPRRRRAPAPAGPRQRPVRRRRFAVGGGLDRRTGVGAACRDGVRGGPAPGGLPRPVARGGLPPGDGSLARGAVRPPPGARGRALQCGAPGGVHELAHPRPIDPSHRERGGGGSGMAPAGGPPAPHREARVRERRDRPRCEPRAAHPREPRRLVRELPRLPLLPGLPAVRLRLRRGALALRSLELLRLPARPRAAPRRPPGGDRRVRGAVEPGTGALAAPGAHPRRARRAGARGGHGPAGGRDPGRGRRGRARGGREERAQAAATARLAAGIGDAGAAGALVFAWLDEWFKHNWVTIDLEVPKDHNPRWLNVEDAEQQYGILGLYAGDGSGPRLGGDPAAWRGLPVVQRGEGPLRALRLGHDEAYLYLAIEADASFDLARHDLALALDVVRPDLGQRRLPGGVRSEVGFEFLLEVRDSARAALLALPEYNPYAGREVLEDGDERGRFHRRPVRPI